ncbi:MAG: lysozyme inhibitor LprI family protein [Pseudomonadota bacterium]
MAALLIAAPAAATEHEVKTYGHVLEACYLAAENAEGRTACIGKMAEACMETEEGGYSTFGMASCNTGEMLVWDFFLNTEYMNTMDWAKAADASEGENFPEFANRVESLRDAQRAWIAFRDAECGMAYAQWGAGSMRHISGTGCVLQMTAERTIELVGYREFQQ